jgi:hypothetical protein
MPAFFHAFLHVVEETDGYEVVGFNDLLRLLYSVCSLFAGSSGKGIRLSALFSLSKGDLVVDV